MGNKKQRSLTVAQQFRSQKAPEFRCSDGVQAARRLVEEQNFGLVEQRASEAEALNRTGRKRANLAIERFAKMELFGELRGPLRCGGVRKLIELAEKEEILPRRQTRIEAMVRACMVAEAAAYVARLVDRVVPRNTREAASRHEQSGEDTQERGLARAVRAKKRKGFAFANFERHASERHSRRLFEGLEEGAPAAAGGWERLRQRFDFDCGFRHQKPYNVSFAWRQSRRALRVRR